MAIDRIAAIALPPALGRQAPLRPGPHSGETVRLTVDATLLDEVLATLPDGRSLRLAGLGPVARGLTTGDVLMMRVLSNGPRLELALLDSPSRSPSPPTTPLTTSQAMRPDQLAQRQLSWRPPDAMALAQSWHKMVLRQFDAARITPVTRDTPSAATASASPLASREGAAAASGASGAPGATARGPAPASRELSPLLPTARDSVTLPAAPRTASNAAASVAVALRDAAMPLATAVPISAPPAPPSANTPLDRWLFPAYAWGGLHVMLRLVDADPEPPPRPPRRQRGPLALNLEVEVPGLGRVAVQVRLVMGGVQLIFFVEHEAALQPVREAIPTLSDALLAADLRLVRCGVVRGKPTGQPVQGTRAERQLPSAQLLPGPLFRAAAEVAVVMSVWVPAEGFSPAARPATDTHEV